MAEPPTPRRTPGGYVPPRTAKPAKPPDNGHAPERPLGLRRSSWEDVDAEDEQQLAAERVRFQRVADVDPRMQHTFSGRPSAAVVLGVVFALGLVVLAVVLYRMAPP